MKNPFPPRTAPDFIPYKETSQRGFAVWKGFEHTVIREEDLEPGDGLRAGDFGRSDDDWLFVIRDEQHVASLRVSSRALNGRLITTPEEARRRVLDIWKDEKKPGPQELHGALDFCTSYPTEEDSIRKAGTGSDCDFQVGKKHYEGESTILGGNSIVLELDGVFMDGPPAWWLADSEIVSRKLLSFEPIWKNLYCWFVEQRVRSMTTSLELPKQCEHCRGAGTVAR